MCQFSPGKNPGLTYTSHGDSRPRFNSQLCPDSNASTPASLGSPSLMLRHRDQSPTSAAHTEGEANTMPGGCGHTETVRFDLKQLSVLETFRMKFRPGLGVPVHRQLSGSWAVIPSQGSGLPPPSPKISLGFQFQVVSQG